MVDTGFVVKTIRVGNGDEFDQVVVPFIRLRQKDQMILGFAVPAGMASGIHIYLATENRLYSRLIAFIKKFNTAKHNPVIG